MSVESLPYLVASVDGKPIGRIIFTRGDTHTLDITFTNLKQPVDVSVYAPNGLLWMIARTLEEKDDPIASGVGTILDDGTQALRGKAQIVIDLTAVPDSEIDHMRNYAIEFTLTDGATQQTAAQRKVPIRQDLN